MPTLAAAVAVAAETAASERVVCLSTQRVAGRRRCCRRCLNRDDPRKGTTRYASLAATACPGICKCSLTQVEQFVRTPRPLLLNLHPTHNSTGAVALSPGIRKQGVSWVGGRSPRYSGHTCSALRLLPEDSSVARTLSSLLLRSGDDAENPLFGRRLKGRRGQHVEIERDRERQGERRERWSFVLCAGRARGGCSLRGETAARNLSAVVFRGGGVVTKLVLEGFGAS